MTRMHPVKIKLLVLCLLVLTACPAPNTNSTPARPTLSSTELLSDRQSSILDLVNNAREKEGLNPLTLNSKLNQAAQNHAEKMIATGIFEHEIEGKKVQDRLEDVDYAWVRAGENLAAGQETAEDVMTSWLESEGHRANILKADFVELGVGAARDDENTLYWVQVFATRE